MMYYRRTIVQTAALSSAFLFRFGAGSQGIEQASHTAPSDSDDYKKSTETPSLPPESEPSVFTESTKSRSPPPENDDRPTKGQYSIKELGRLCMKQTIHSNTHTMPDHDKDKFPDLNVVVLDPKPVDDEEHPEPEDEPSSSTSEGSLFIPYLNELEKEAMEAMNQSDFFQEAMDHKEDLEFTRNPLLDNAYFKNDFSEEEQTQIYEESMKTFDEHKANVKPILEELEEAKLITPAISSKLVVKDKSGVLRWHFETVSRAFKLYDDHFNKERDVIDIMTEKLEEWEDGKAKILDTKATNLICSADYSFKTEYWDKKLLKDKLKDDNIKREVYEYCRTGIISGSRTSPHNVYGSSYFDESSLEEAREKAYDEFFSARLVQSVPRTRACKQAPGFKLWWLSDKASEWRWKLLCWKPSIDVIRCQECEIMMDKGFRRSRGIVLPFEREEPLGWCARCYICVCNLFMKAT